MSLRSHGAVRSFSSSLAARFPFPRPMRHLHAHGAGLRGCCRCHRRFLSSSTRAHSLLHRSPLRMSARKTMNQAWHVSHGIVFAGGSDVVYPRLPPVRHHSAPVAVAAEGDSACLPTVLLTANAPEDPSAGQRAENTHGDTVTTMTTFRTTITTTVSDVSATVIVEGGAVKGVQAPAQDTAKKPKPKDAAPIVCPYTPLDFKIPDKAFREAREAPEGAPQSFWGYSLYRGPGEKGALDAKVKVHYCTSSRTTERVIKEYFTKEKVLGFDLEWMASALKTSGPRKNVSLIQLASPTRIGLFHVAAFPKNDALVAPSLKKLMEDPEITKVGVSIKGDCKRMSDFLNVKPRGQFELSHLYKLVKFSKSGEHGLINKKLVALATQVKECLGLPMFKGSDVRTSDWTKPLNMTQIIYSSSDAYAAVQLYAVLNHMRENLDDVPPVPHHAELNLPIPVVLPAATEVQDPAPEPAAEGNSALQEQIVLEDGPIPEDGSAPEEGPVPQDQLVRNDKALIVNSAPRLEPSSVGSTGLNSKRGPPKPLTKLKNSHPPPDPVQKQAHPLP